MRTYVFLDNQLVNEAFKYTKVKTKRELIHQALQEFVEHHRRLDVGELRGIIKIRRGYNHKKLRMEER